MSDLNLLALCLWREARGEGEDGMRAVACVVMNRVKAKWGTLQKVILGKNQFTSMSVPSDSQFTLQPKANDKLYKIASEIAEEAIAGELEDTTKGALYYANLKIATSGWFFKNIVGKPKEHPETVQIGRHSFFA